MKRCQHRSNILREIHAKPTTTARRLRAVAVAVVSIATWSVFGCLVVMTEAVMAEQELTESDYVETPITDDDRSHWSFQPLKRIQVPQYSATWRRNIIDDIVGNALQEEGLTPQQEAPRVRLIRRLSFDLIGLPPTPAEIEAFVADQSNTAYEELVTRLLNSPRHGERWAQHWLDLARFAETDGFEHDKLRAEAWKYRDWVIKALNDDMPYDEFVRLQIAGDEISPDDSAAITATGFCLSGPDMPDINLTKERQHNVLNELASTVGEVFLGLQIGCAQCHDHKYDPISQADFYRLRAIFEPSVELKKNRSLTVLHESFPYKQTSHLRLRGDFRRPGPAVEPGVIRVVSTGDADYQPVPSTHSAGRRTALANWLVADTNPLTARVIVNRVWQHHFGTGIVDSPSEFGLMGSEPGNLKLLDTLASYLIDNDWSLKKLHRLIVTSATYRQRSSLLENATAAERTAWKLSLDVDPRGTLLSRHPRYRLEGEAIRDAMLVAADRLNLKVGGPGVRPPLPAELTGTLLKNQWDVTEDASEHFRRSIYVFARRNLRYPIFEVFDRPSANVSCSDRGNSTTAPQSLHLLNSEFSLETATQLSSLIAKSHVDQRSQISAAFQKTLGRLPTEADFTDVTQFMQQQSDASNEADALTHLCLSLFNSNEFVFVD